MKVILKFVDGGTAPGALHLGAHRGFLPKPGGIRIITFRVTARLQSKSNRCI
jgi:hypothetical protein